MSNVPQISPSARSAVPPAAMQGTEGVSESIVKGKRRVLADIAQEVIRRLRGTFRKQSKAEVQLSWLVDALVSNRGETSGKILAAHLLDCYGTSSAEEKKDFFDLLATKYGAESSRLEKAIAAYQKAPSPDTAARLHAAAEPRRQELIRRVNMAEGGTKALVDMRAEMSTLFKESPHFPAVDSDFAHLLGSWFNRGFLTLRRIDWSTPADILEKIIRYEAVHAIESWNELRLRLEPPDRRCFAFFHPAMPGEPLIFVEVALVGEMPGAIQPLLAERRTPLDTGKATTAVFYSISNCQDGLRGISFGNFLIKQVVEELRRELPGLQTFVTLSPVPGMARWLRSDEGQTALDDKTRAILESARIGEAADALERSKAQLTKLAYRYLALAKDRKDKPVDPVARFHLGNGARLHRVNWMGDTSSRGLADGFGFMVNYLYQLDEIELNHEKFANEGEIAMSPAVKRQIQGLNAAEKAPRRTRAVRKLS